MALRNACQLITYPDSLGGNLKELRSCLSRYFEGAVEGIHMLPFYPSSGDRGFAPISYDMVDPRFGSWSDIDVLGEKYDLIVDFMVNHISSRSAYFSDYLEHGETSPYADLFLRFSRLKNGKEVSQEDLSKIFRRKPGDPVIEIELKDGSRERVWCTFSDEQIDLNLASSAGKKLLLQWLNGLAAHPIKMVRLDAFAYVIKQLGTSCFFVEPDTSDLLMKIAAILAPHHIEILPEIHAHHSVQLKLAGQGHWVYDFNLPLLVMHSLYEATNQNLLRWLQICPRKQVTTLDTHDGLPVLDIEHLMTSEEIERTKETLFSTGANAQRRFSLDSAYKNANLYQLNSTYYSALGDHDESYLTARAIQFFAPGIPQVYYVGLLAGRNDVELAERTKLGRDINRHNYSAEEIERQVKRPVVQRLIKLMRFRNTHPAFSGQFSVHPSNHDQLVLEWKQSGQSARLEADLKRRMFRVFATNESGELREQELI